MKIFASLSQFIETPYYKGKLGRWVANANFLDALLDYSDFDEYHFYFNNIDYYQYFINYIESRPYYHKVEGKIRGFYKSQLIENLKKYDYFVFHQTGWYLENPNLIYLRNTKIKKKFVITGITHSLNDFSSIIGMIKYITSLPSDIDSIIATTSTAKKVLNNLEKEVKTFLSNDYNNIKINISVIPLGYEYMWDKKTSLFLNKEEARAHLGINKDSFILLYLGRLSIETKTDLFNFLFNIRDFLNNRNKITLILAGSATEEEIVLINNIIDYLEINKSKIKIFTNFDDNLKPYIYKASDVLVSFVDNLQETFGISVVEAKFFGVVPIVTDWDGYKDIVDDGQDGFKIKTYSYYERSVFDYLNEGFGFYSYNYIYSQSIFIDYKDFFNKINYLIENKDQLKKMSINAKGSAIKYFSWKRIIEQYLDLWETLYNRNIKQYKNYNLLYMNHRNIFKDYPSFVSSEYNSLVLKENWEKNFSVLKVAPIEKYIDLDKVYVLLKENKLQLLDPYTKLLLLKWNVLDMVF